MKTRASALLILLAACSSPAPQTNEAAIYAAGEGEQPLTPGVQPVRIGDSGPGFAACGTIGRVVNLSPSGEATLPVRSAPFVEASEVARLDVGARLYVCSRSLDQRWQGVVAPPADTPDADCGVTAPVASPRAYAGPCRSGWVSSAFVRLVGR